MEWTGQVYADTPVVAAQTYIEAPPERVWALVSDIYLMPGLSAELQEVAWLDGVSRPGPRPPVRRPQRQRVPRNVGDGQHGDRVRRAAPVRVGRGRPRSPVATWRFTLRPDGAGTILEQWARMGPGRSGLSLAIDAMPDKEAKIVFVRLREWEAALKHNLAEIKEMAERTG